jgi:hypothetical protein
MNTNKWDLEHYMNTDKRVQLAAEVSRLAQTYGDHFKKVEEICGNRGSVAQVVMAENWLLQSIHPPDNILPPENILPGAMETAKSLISMDRAKKELMDDGVPAIVLLEITRRILDKDIHDSKPLLVHEEFA